MRNRYGNEYWFEPVGENTYRIAGQLDYWRFGGNEGEESVDMNNLGFADPSGGPFIARGYQVEGRVVVRIRSVDNQVLLDVE